MDKSQKNNILKTLLGLILATSCCWLPALVIFLGGILGFSNFQNGLNKSSNFITFSGLILIGFGLYQFYKNKKGLQVILTSKIICPKCQHAKLETMPIDACQYFYECESCQAILKPLDNDCCVYCSYGSVPCPPIQCDEECC